MKKDLLKKAAEDLCKCHGLNIVNDRSNCYAYHDHTLYTRNSGFLSDGGEYNYWMICHDLAHFLVATEDERLLPEFGLGNGKDLPAVLSEAELERREAVAYILGISFILDIGGDLTDISSDPLVLYHPRAREFDDNPRYWVLSQLSNYGLSYQQVQDVIATAVNVSPNKAVKEMWVK